MKSVVLLLLTVFGLLVLPPSLMARESPAADTLKKLNGFLQEHLQRDEIDATLVKEEIRNRFNFLEISELAKLSFVLANGTTSVPGSIEDHRRLMACTWHCIEILRDGKAVPELRDIYFRVQMKDGYHRIWTEILGAEWETLLMLSPESGSLTK